MDTKLVVIAAVLAAFCSVGGCQQASSPSSVDRAVANAKADAQKQDQKALEDQAKKVASANSDLGNAEQKADVQKADSAYDVAVTEAEGRHEVALKRCDGLAGAQQKACKDQVDAALDLAKANAKAQMAAIKNGN
jgi:hypothetical protein